MHELMRSLHILSSIVFMAGLLPTALFAEKAMRLEEPAPRLAAMRIVIGTTRILLTPGALLAGITGFGLAGVSHTSIVANPWLLLSVILYLAALLVSLTILAPSGARMMKAAEAATRGSDEAWKAVLANPLPGYARAFSHTAGIAVLLLMLFHGVLAH